MVKYIKREALELTPTDTQAAVTAQPAASVRPTSRSLASLGVWPGIVLYLVSLAGTLLLQSESLRLCAVLLLLAAGILAVVLWGGQAWAASFAPRILPTSAFHPKPTIIWPIVTVFGSGLIILVADLYQAANPTEMFGLAGWLWLVGIVTLLASTFPWSLSSSTPRGPTVATLPTPPVDSTLPVRRAAFAPATGKAWQKWEVAVFAFIVVVAFALRVWNLRDYPNNVYPDEIMTGTVATQSFTGQHPASVFSTVWGDIELPALWFLIVSWFLQAGGHLLNVLRLPSALFGAATVVPFYFLVRGVWGRVAAIAGSAILAFSASNIHYSRLALNNIVTQFFWAACFLFLLRGLRSRRLLDWALAGLFAGLSEHFYYGTRLLPFILVIFFAYLLVVHWRQAKSFVSYFAVTALGYFVGFGPLLAYFMTHPGLYFGRGSQLLVWNHIPSSWADFQQMLSVIGPIIGENFLGISTRTSQDIMYYGTLLLVSEAALLMLGVALLMWKWRHPAAFLMLLSGLGVLFVGGSLVIYPDSSLPFINHWTPAFPAFYCALAIPVASWFESDRTTRSAKLAWVKPAVLAAGLVMLGWLNVGYYFGSYHASPDSLRSENYSRAQGYYDIQVAESRYLAGLGTSYTTVVVGRSPVPYDGELTRYLLGNYANLQNVENPDNGLALPTDAKHLAFIFFPGNEQYRQSIQTRYPGGVDGEVKGDSGKVAFYTYQITR
jgi:4-amino-4-deoxy-L-arabinose transferase-like glycosyltransferase